MNALLDTVDPDGLLEYSVVFTDRSLNHMSGAFQGVMCDISAMLKEVYRASHVAVIPGGGTFAMEAVARQFAGDQDVLVVRNGWFSFRWSQILDAAKIAREVTVIKARPMGNSAQSPYAPRPSKRSRPRSARAGPASSSRRMSKPRPGSFCPMIISRRWPRPPTRLMRFWCLIASRLARSGSIWPPRASMC